MKLWQLYEPAGIKQTISLQLFLVVLSWEVQYNKALNDWHRGKQRVLFRLDPQCSPRLCLREH